ncbi:MAG TPA: RHS repeat-associated core domain-containing protein [Pyrinomonadaceae bacterium]|nr:RHS repeat-associated core domain-containing protein [Pyrinomonadaceae bacterium]
MTSGSVHFLGTRINLNATKTFFIRARSIKSLVLAAILIVISAWSIEAQTATDGKTPLGMTPGSPSGSYELSGFDNVNLYNGNLNFQLPLLGIGGRGDAQMALLLALNLKGWRVLHTNPSGVHDNYKPISGWWSGSSSYVPKLEGRQSGTGFTDCSSYPGGNTNAFGATITRLTFLEPDGSEHELIDQLTGGQPLGSYPNLCSSVTGASRGTVFISHDGEATTFISDTTIYDRNTPGGSALYPSGYLMLRNGTRYRFDNGTVTWLRDRNGNRLSFTYGSSTKITDSLNRQVTIAYNVADVAPYGVCDQITFKGFGGAPRVIRVSKTSLSSVLRQASSYSNHPAAYTLQTYQQLFPELNAFQSGNYNPASIVSAVWLPDGSRRYQFYYNSYGELARVELPTGGAVEYDMTVGSGVITGDSLYNDDYLQIYRRVVERRMYADGVTLEGKQTYSATYSSSEDPTPWSTTVTVDQVSPGGTILAREKHYFYGSGAASLFRQSDPTNQHLYSAWKEGKENQTEALDTNGVTVLRRVTNTWAQRAPVSWWTFGADDAPANDPRLTQTVSTLVDTNQVAQQTFAYDQYNNKTDAYEYDYGAGTAGPLMRRIHTDYLVTNSINGADYTATNIHIRSLASQSSVYDAGGIERARTTIEYDYYATDTNHAALFDRPSISGLDSSFTPSYSTRGNATATTRYLLVNGSVTGSISAYAQYDIAGNPVKTLDGRGNAANLFYTDCFGAPDGEAITNSAPLELSSVGQASYAFPTSVTNAANQTVYSQFDYYLGRPVDGKDVNGIVSSGFYNDVLDRPTQVIRAYGVSGLQNQTTFSYDDANHIVTTASDLTTNTDGALVSKALYDGLGRATESRTYEGGTNYIAAQTQYDALGRAYKTSNPFRPWQSEAAVWTTSAFDALGRVVSVTTPDSAAVTSSYSGNTITVTDQAGKQRQSVTDGLGRLSSVYEDPSGLNHQTSYSYDPLDDLVTVTQDSQTRNFVYDSLKRLTSATNPESGTVSYQYDNNGNLTSKTDARPITTTFAYDALNRAVTRSYSDSTPTVTYTYDAASVANSKGRLTSVSSSVSTTNYTAYDALGRLTSSNQVTDGETYSMSDGYNLAGGQTSITYPSGRVITSEYDAAEKLAGVRDQQSGVYYAGAASTDATNRMQYAAHGAVSAMKLGNGLWEHTSFNNRLQPTQIGLGASSADSSTMGLSYDYGTTNNNGNLQSVSYSGGGLSYTQSFGYDALNRLTTSNENSGSSWSQTNGYDQYGNRWIDYGGGVHNLSFSGSTNRITTSGYNYDSAGNLTNDSIHSYGFDAENKITTVDGVSGVYGYDGDGNRVRKNLALGEQVRMVYSGGQLIAEYDISTGSLKKEYVYGAKGLIATIDPSAGTSYMTSDHLGTPRVVTNSSGSVMSRHDYLPFGEEIGVTIGGRTSGMGYGVADSERQKFTSKERDNESGLDYFGARYYGSTQGRFTSVDPDNAGADVNDPQSWNGYAYVGNSPLTFTDPEGLWKEVDCTSGAGKCYESDNKKDTITSLAKILHVSAGDLNKFFQNPTIHIGDAFDASGFGRGGITTSRDEGPAVIEVFLVSEPPRSRSDAMLAGAVALAEVDPEPTSKSASAALAIGIYLLHDRLKREEEARERTPVTHPDEFEHVRGTPARRNTRTGEVWERDRLHKNHWEVYRNKKDYDNGRRDRSVWDNGDLKEKF